MGLENGLNWRGKKNGINCCYAGLGTFPILPMGRKKELFASREWITETVSGVKWSMLSSENVRGILHFKNVYENICPWGMTCK